MAIDAGNSIHFFGAQDSLGTSSATVADDSFSIASDLSTWTNDDDAAMASIAAFFDYAVAPDSNSFISLYVRPLSIDTTNDQEIPTATFQHTYVGSFSVSDVTTNQYSLIHIALPNNVTSQQYEFYIHNQTGQTIQAGWDLHVTPLAFGAAP